jgi:SAM-dependent methyltransferase
LSATGFEPGLPGRSADLVVIRSVLELVPDPVGFLRDARAALAPGGLCYLEVPNAEWVLRDGMAWNIHYEHCSYFTAGTLRTVCAAAGLRVLESVPVYHDGQYLRAIAVLDAVEPAVMETARRFGASYRAAVASWTQRLRAAGDAGRRVILWGAGGRGASFLAAVDRAGVLVQFTVDVNPARHGTYLPVTGHPIRSPDAITGAAVDVIIVANDTYLAEITRMARARGFEGELWAL